MSNDIDIILCRKCKYVGEYSAISEVEKKSIFSMLGRYRKNNIKIRRNRNIYDVTITLTAYRKVIEIDAIQNATISEFYDIVMEVLRFENLFEGLFYSIKSFVADGMEYVDNIRNIQLAYYESRKIYTYFHMDFSDAEYKRLFHRWLKIEKQIKIVHPVFLVSTYLEGMPVDVRMAMLLEIFEPVAEALHDKGKISLVKQPYITYKNTCKKCGALVSRKCPNKELYFADKLKPLLKQYGKDIFADDNKSKLITKAVNIRNKVDHVKANTRNAMTANQCGTYIYKFSLMYRYIMLLELGLPSAELIPIIKVWVEDFNKRYGHLMLKK